MKAGVLQSHGLPLFCLPFAREALGIACLAKQLLSLWHLLSIASPRRDLAKWLEMLEKLQGKTSFISARWWVKFLISQFTQTKHVKHKHEEQAQGSWSYVLFNLFLQEFFQGVL